jgi:predicted nuclease with RNAse H fold
MRRAGLNGVVRNDDILADQAAMSSPLTVAGIDVGGAAKGFHGVALRDGAVADRHESPTAAETASWCRDIGACVIGIDAPCHWSATGHARAAERELMEQKIWCFSTPSEAAAQAHPGDHFRWMKNGMELFAALASSHTLYRGDARTIVYPAIFETYPHAIACALSGKVVSAKAKHSIRRALLKKAGLDITTLTSIDLIDAALCALTAHRFQLGDFKTYGVYEDGLVVVPCFRIATKAPAAGSDGQAAQR